MYGHILIENCNVKQHSDITYICNDSYTTTESKSMRSGNILVIIDDKYYFRVTASLDTKLHITAVVESKRSISSYRSHMSDQSKLSCWKWQKYRANSCKRDEHFKSAILSVSVIENIREQHDVHKVEKKWIHCCNCSGVLTSLLCLFSFFYFTISIFSIH